MNLYTWKTEAAAKEGFRYAKEGNEEKVRELIDHSFHIGDCDEQGNSLLHYAVLGKNLKLVQFLTEQCGLEPTWANKALVTPFDLAHEQQGEEALAAIETYFEGICGFSYKDCYRNPVCRGMHPDPSMVRVGEDYYMVNSSFIFFPCIPISHSKDLVHWEVIGHAVTDREWAMEHLGQLEGGRGFWAPDISYHNGRFYVCATLRNNDDAEFFQTQMVTSSDRPEGPYELPVIHNVLGIDPSIFTDDDGRRYMLLNRGARIMEISEDGKEVLSEASLIWYGHSGRAPEGPHIIKKDGYYYCFLAEGGTGKGHMVTVGRSRHLMGPYEDCPYNPIMTQKDAIAPIQCCGHGKPVQTQDGRWFMVYLCSRFLDDTWGMLGRETCLDEVTWTQDGWPLVNQRKGPSYMNALAFPKEGNRSSNPETWLTPRTWDTRYVTVDVDVISIRGDGHDLCSRDCKSLLLKCQPDLDFFLEFEMEISEEEQTGFTSDAGVTLYYDENTYIKFGINQDGIFVTEYVDDAYVRTESFAYPLESSMVFGVETKGLIRKFYVDRKQLCQWDEVTSICSEGLVKGKRFTGAMYGVYVNGNNLLRWRQHSSN